MSTVDRPYTIVEAGYSRYPSIGAPGRRHLPKDQLYVALGQFDSQFLFLQTQFWMSVWNDPHEDTGFRMVRPGAITNMPFGDNLADEMIVPEFFSNPFTTAEERTLAAGEMRRVVRPLGTLTVVEAANSDVMPASELADVLAEFGFHQVNAGREYDPLTVSQYSDITSDLGYVAAFVLQQPNQDS